MILGGFYGGTDGTRDPGYPGNLQLDVPVTSLTGAGTGHAERGWGLS